jgi:hypothetical protein
MFSPSTGFSRLVHQTFHRFCCGTRDMRRFHERLCYHFNARARVGAMPIAALCCRSQTARSNYWVIVAQARFPHQAKPLGSAYR